MKGKTLVIGIILFVILIVGAIYFAMTATINKIEKEGTEESSAVAEYNEIDAEALLRLLNK